MPRWPRPATSRASNIRISSGTRNESIDLAHNFSTALYISGGWIAPMYLKQVADPSATVFDRGGERHPDLGGVLRGSISNRSVSIRNLSLRGGNAARGGGASLHVSIDGQLRISQVDFDDNLADNTLDGFGGGLQLRVSEGLAYLDRVRFRRNRAVSRAGAYGAGAHVEILGGGEFSAERTEFEDNQTDGDSASLGGALLLRVAKGQACIQGCRITGNRVLPGLFGADAAAVQAQVESDAQLRVGSCVVAGNEGGGNQFTLYAGGTSYTQLASVALGQSPLSGLAAIVHETTARLDVAHLTSAGHAGTGASIHAPNSTGVRVFNSLLWGNAGGQLLLDSPYVAQDHNLVQGTNAAADPRFVDAAAGDYRLHRGSPAIDAGHPTLYGGTGFPDAGLGLRRRGAAPDQGAFERGGLTPFAGGFEDNEPGW